MDEELAYPIAISLVQSPLRDDMLYLLGKYTNIYKQKHYWTAAQQVGPLTKKKITKKSNEEKRFTEAWKYYQTYKQYLEHNFFCKLKCRGVSHSKIGI